MPVHDDPVIDGEDDDDPSTWWSWSDDAELEALADRALDDGPPPFPGPLAVHEVAILAQPGRRWGAQQVIYRDTDGDLDDDLAVAWRLPDGSWDIPSASGSGVPEEVFDRATAPRWPPRRSSGQRFMRPLPPRGPRGDRGLLWYLGDHVAGFTIDGVTRWGVAFSLFALPGVVAARVSYGPDVETWPVPEHGIFLAAGEVTGPYQVVEISALDASGHVVDTLTHTPFTTREDYAGGPIGWWPPPL